MAKIRLDQLLFSRGLATSRTAAQALVMEGKVRVDGRVETKAGRAVAEDVPLEVEAPPRFVSRGGEKLEGAFAKFSGWTVDGLVCLDVGSSTGGFTDCMLQHGAARVMAVDVGTNQLAYKLRVDPRVWVRENFNARNMTIADLPERPARAVTDVSFISLKLILPPMAEVLFPGGEIVSLIKPQFEAGRGNAPGGVVNDPEVRTWQYCIPIIWVQTLSAPLGWAAQNLLFPALVRVLPVWFPPAALRPIIFVTCSLLAMGVVWLVLGASRNRAAYRDQLPAATFNCCVLGTLLIAANQNYSLLQSIAFGLGSGIGYLVAVLVVDEGRRRLRSKEIPAIFRGLPSSLIYIGILSLAIYGLVGTGNTL